MRKKMWLLFTILALGAVGVALPALAHTPAARQRVEIQAHAFVSRALMPVNERQTLFVIVQDQNYAGASRYYAGASRYYHPVEGAMVSVSVAFPDGSQYDVRAPQTDADGISRLEFLVGEMPLREVAQVKVDVMYQGSNTSAATWFRIWW
ncbi:MAG: hypothetical protein U1B80_03560 [Anaerolineaceae bacterium]|nr:hypothetical protein [Anaerolineaceae bacterium]